MTWNKRRDERISRLEALVLKLGEQLDEARKNPDRSEVGGVSAIVAQMTESIGKQLTSMGDFVAQAVASQAATFQRQIDLLGALEERDAERERREEDKKKRLREERAQRAVERQNQGRDAQGRILPKNPAPAPVLRTGDCPACVQGESAFMTREQTIAHMQHRNARAAAARGANGSAAIH